MPKGGIWLGLSSKDLLNLQLKQNCMLDYGWKLNVSDNIVESFWRGTYRGGSFASMQRLDDGEVR